MSTKNQIKLSPKQEEIAGFTYGALRVLASAGSGKTRVLTERIKRLSEITKRKILAITFTNKASEEIKERLNEDIDINEKLFVGTFHSFCISVIESHGSLIGFNEVPQIFSNTDDRLKVLEAAIINTPTIKQSYSQKDTKERNKLRYDILEYFSQIKREVVLDEELETKIGDKDVILLYKVYSDIMTSMNAIDFDDLLLLVYKLFISNPKIASLYRRNYEFICVDEAQDLNKAQYMLLRALTGNENKNIMLVGDPNQSIYGFNGSSSKYMKDCFTSDYAPKEIVLSENYRSSRKVLELANKIIPASSSLDNVVVEGVCEIHHYDSPECEASWVLSKIKELIDKKDIAGIENPVTEEGISILARNKFVFADIEAKLKANNIDYYFKSTGGEVVYDSELMQVLLLALQIKINPLDRLHLSQLQRLVKLSKKSSLDEIIKSSIEDSHKEIIKSIVGLNIDGSNFKKTISRLEAEFQNIDNYKGALNENERAYFIYDCKSLLKHWHRYEVNASTKTLSSFRNAMSLGQTAETSMQKGIALSTVHTMKGQENNIVFLIGMDNETFPDYRAINKGGIEMEQERNNLYVAITRAKRHLYVTYPTKRTMPWGGEKARAISTFLKDCCDFLSN